MGKEKGFTLIELLAVITLIGILSLITMPVVNKMIQSSSTKIYKMNEASMASAAEGYYGENVELLPQGDGNKAIVFLDDLSIGGFIKPIKSLKDKKTLCEGFVVVEYKEGIGYEYSPYLNCKDDYVTSYADLKLIIGALGPNPQQHKIGSSYIEYGAVAFSIADGDISNNIVISHNINFNVVGSYIVTYHITDSLGNIGEVKRQVLVVN